MGGAPRWLRNFAAPREPRRELRNVAISYEEEEFRPSGIYRRAMEFHAARSRCLLQDNPLGIL